MRAVLQRVTRGSCTVEGRVTGEIGAGLVVLLGVAPDDTPAKAEALAAKITKLRIFSDDAGKMNRSLLDVGGDVLSISQFTLFADTRSGNRPSYIGAASPELGRELYAHFNEALRSHGPQVAEGIFGAHMEISLVNDGPVTIWLEV